MARQQLGAAATRPRDQVTKYSLDGKAPNADVYNWKASNTRRFQRSIGKAISGTGYSDHVVIGDSQTSSLTGAAGGGTPVSNFAVMWPRVLRNQLEAKGLPLGGTGWCFANDTSNVQDDRWSFTGTWNDGYGYRATPASGTTASTATFVADVSGTAIQLAYLDVAYAAPFQVSVNGGTPVTVTPTDASGKVSYYTVTSLSEGRHIVVVSTSANNTFLLAARCYRPAGIQIHMAAQQGARATTTFGSSSFTSFPNRAFNIKSMVPDPDVVHISLGPNDIGNGATVAATVAAVQAIRGQFPNADCILYGQYETTVTSGQVWVDYVNALRNLADTLDVPMLNLFQRSGGLATAKANGMYVNDDVHLTYTAESDWAAAVADLFPVGAVRPVGWQASGGVQFPPVSNPPYARGLLYYDTDNECLTYLNNDSNVGLQIGQELWQRVRNVTGSTIPNGTPVYVTGVDSGWPTVAPARADLRNTADILGITTEAIPTASMGHVATAGMVRGVDTSAYAAGAVLYVSSVTAGALTATSPAAPAFRARVGRVAVANATTGVIIMQPTVPVLGDGGVPADMVLTHTAGVTTRAVGAGDFATGLRVGRAFTLTSVIYQFGTADASGSTTVELRRNGTQVTSSSVAVTAANQADGTSTDAARTVTVNQAFAVGDRIALQITAIGTTPGKGLRAWLVGTWT